MSKVFVLNADKQPLDPVHPGRARILLRQGKAAVYRRFPFCIILKSMEEQPGVQALRLKIDPGSRTTGLAILNDTTGEVVFAAELMHRGAAIKQKMDTRRVARHARRLRKTRYRPPRFQNRRRRTGKLPPSLASRVANVITWVQRLMRVCPITALSQELVKFDTQAMQHPGIQSIEYQQGELAGYEVREFLLDKWSRRCAYCDRRGLPLQVEHIQSRARGGTNRVSNLTLACAVCNVAKGTQHIRDFLKDQPERLEGLLALAREPLKDAAAVTTTRWVLYEQLQACGVPLETGSGGRTRYNRSVHHLPKTHWLDAANVGKSTPDMLRVKHVHPLFITATGHGSRQMCRMSKFGFPRTAAKQHKCVQGFITGDLVRAVVPRGKKAGTYVGRVAVRSTGFFNMSTQVGTIEGVSYKYCCPIHRCDGYAYHSEKGGGIPPTSSAVGGMPQKS
jgi:5-methylcytosine-specific restriction endonuclease McrA